MFYSIADGLRPAPLTHNPLNALVMPRPIGWISSISAAGVLNLAPYSYFNLVCADPPYVMFAPNSASAGTCKDTYRNICEVPEFVANVVGEQDLAAMNASSAPFPPEVDEFAACGISSVRSTLVRPPRVASARAALECRVYQVVHLPPTRDGRESHVVVGEVLGVYIADGMIVNGLVDERRLQPVTRLGYMNYGTLGNVIELLRPQ
ncbi:MAG: flavin reductase family protein [Gammaproteobacteria bacterium]